MKKLILTSILFILIGTTVAQEWTEFPIIRTNSIIEGKFWFGAQPNKIFLNRKSDQLIIWMDYDGNFGTSKGLINTASVWASVGDDLKSVHAGLTPGKAKVNIEGDVTVWMGNDRSKDYLFKFPFKATADQEKVTLKHDWVDNAFTQIMKFAWEITIEVHLKADLTFDNQFNQKEVHRAWTFKASNLKLEGTELKGNLTISSANFFTSIVPENQIIPENFALAQNYPNPFNPETTIEYDLPERTNVHIAVYDQQGKLIENLVNEEQYSGKYKYTWQPENVSSGIYLLTMRTDKYTESKKLILVK